MNGRRPMMMMHDDARPFPLESDLFARIAWAAAASAGVTLLVALVVGGLLVLVAKWSISAICVIRSSRGRFCGGRLAVKYAP